MSFVKILLQSICLQIISVLFRHLTKRSIAISLFLALASSSVLADSVFIYSSSNNLYGVNLTSQQESFLTTASLSSSVNVLASNSTHGIIYYGDETSIYYWDPALGLGPNSHALINNFDNGFFQAPIHNLNSAGGSFLNGKYYVGSETDNGFIEDIFELTMSADGRQLVSVVPLDIHSACGCSEVQLGGFGDLAVVEEGGGPVIYGSSAELTNNNQGTHAGIWRFELNSNNWTLLADGEGGQAAKSLDGRVFTNIGNSIRELNTTTGVISSQTLMTTSQAIWDFTGGFSYDFGDAPDSYGAATHLVGESGRSVFLGDVPPDNEPYTLHSGVNGVDGRGDDQTGIDDEDALDALLDLQVGDSEYAISVQCSSGGYVASWIDFNLNGKFDFNERNENHPVRCQGNSAELRWSGFTIANAGSSFARLRVAAKSDDIYKPTGYVDNGEVEDYEITFTGGVSVSGNCPAGSASHIYTSVDVPKSYSGTNGSPTTSVINIPDSLVITDVNMLDLQTTQNSQRQVYFVLNHDSDRVYLYGNACWNNTSLNIGFDDEAASNVACSPANGQLYRPNRVLSAFDGSDAQGVWDLQIYNFRRRNSGTVKNWALEICALSTVEPVTDIRLGKVVEVVGRTVTVTLLAKNTGNTPVSNVQIADNLDDVFGAGNYQVSAAPQLLSAPAGFSINANFSGQTASSTLISASGELQPDDELKIVFSVDVDYAAPGAIESYDNQGFVTAIDNFGTSVSDASGTGLDLSIDEDNLTNISLSSALVVNGVVFEDSSSNRQTSHDGIQQASEVGVAGLAVRIVDVATGSQIATAITAADGSWVASIDPVYTGQSIEVVVTADSVSQFISESPVSNNSNVADGRVSFVAQPNSSNGSFINKVYVGLVKRPSLVLDQTANVNAGASTQYAHKYRVSTHGELEFSFDTVSSAQSSGWAETIYHDFNCNALIDSTDIVINGSIPVLPNEIACVVVVVDAPVGGLPGASQQLKLIATMYATDGSATGHGVKFENENNDLTTIVGESAGNLVLKKSVNNMSLGGPAVTQNTALPGHILEYIIVYSNAGNGVINDLVINDEAPAFTQIDPASALCSQTPQALVCTADTSGSLVKWSFQGNLPAGAGGIVSYQVTVD